MLTAPDADGLVSADPFGRAADPLIGRTINERFRLTSLIARGGMGRVYRAEQAPLGRICAVKVLDRSSVGEIGGALDKRFRLEATVTSRLNHPNIVTVFECGWTDDNIHYMAMEYLAGRTLGGAIRAVGRLPEGRAVHIARQTCRALREAHAAGVVHRDLKPTNVFLLDRDDELDFVKVLDFGLVTEVASERREELTEKNLLLGSPRYMAPEQIRGERVDARTDVYALGIVIYEMITGRVPFAGPGSAKILTAHLNEAAAPMRGTHGANPSPALEAVVNRCIEKSPGGRFRSMAEVLAALDALSGSAPSIGDAAAAAVEHPTGDGCPPLIAAPQAPTRRQGGLFGHAAACAVAVVAIGALVAWGSRERGALESRSGVAPAGSSSAGAAAVSAETPCKAPLVEPMATVQVTTDPAASRVKEGEVELCPSTPCAILYEGADAHPGASHVLTLTHEGYRSETRSVSGADGTVIVSLTPIAPGPHRGISRDGDGTRLSGYKVDVPY
jgi:serine/threonine-protein kinase